MRLSTPLRVVSVICFFSFEFLLFSASQSVFARSTLTLTEGPTSHQSNIDMYRKRATLNFVYEGCDSTPSADNLDFGNLSNGKPVNCTKYPKYVKTLPSGRKQVFQNATIGEVKMVYKDPAGTPSNCAQKTRVSLHKSLNTQKIYNYLKSNNCNADVFKISDDNGTDKANDLMREMDDMSLCKIPAKRITFPGFPTEGFPQGIKEVADTAKLRVRDGEFRIGKHWNFRWDRKKGQWCKKFVVKQALVNSCKSYRRSQFQKQNLGQKGRNVETYVNGCNPKPENCGNHSVVPTPILHAVGGKYHINAAVQLNTDGTAEIRAVEKSFNSKEEAFPSDPNKPKPWVDAQNPKKGVIKINVKSFKDGNLTSVSAIDGNGDHKRTVEFFPRNMIGADIMQSWCDSEHCYARGVEAGQTCRNKRKNPLNLNKGGSGNLCYSCMGITPGLCQTKELVNYKPTGGADPWEAALSRSYQGAANRTQVCLDGNAESPSTDEISQGGEFQSVSK